MTDTPRPRLRPLFLVKPKTMTRRDINRAEKQCGICIAECSDPESAHLLETPFDAGLDVQARAALSLTRTVISMGAGNATFYKWDLMKWLLDALMAPPPKPVAPVKRK